MIYFLDKKNRDIYIKRGIKNSKKEELYTELDRISEPSTIFEVYASHPIFDIYGNVQYFESHLKRTQVQSND